MCRFRGSADVVAGATQNACEMHEMLYFSMEPVAPKLATQGLRNDGCETVLDHSRNRTSIGIRVFTCFDVKISAVCEPPHAHFVAGVALCVPPCADFLAGTALCERKCSVFLEPVRFCERRVQDGLGSFSNHSWIIFGIGIKVFTCFLK